MNIEDFFTFTANSLQPVKDSDIESLVEIINEAYSYQDEVKGSKRTSIEHLQKRVEETQFYAAKDTNRITGCFYIEDKFPALHFGLLTVIKDLRGKGLAQAMMFAIESYAKAKKFKTVDLDYMSLAPWLKAYYEKYGYKETGEITEWGSINLVHMTKEIS